MQHLPSFTFLGTPSGTNHAYLKLNSYLLKYYSGKFLIYKLHKLYAIQQTLKDN